MKTRLSIAVVIAAHILFGANIHSATCADKLRAHADTFFFTGLCSVYMMNVPAWGISIGCMSYSAMLLKEAERLEAATIISQKYPITRFNESKNIINKYYRKLARKDSMVLSVLEVTQIIDKINTSPEGEIYCNKLLKGMPKLSKLFYKNYSSLSDLIPKQEENLYTEEVSAFMFDNYDWFPYQQ